VQKITHGPRNSTQTLALITQTTTMTSHQFMYPKVTPVARPAQPVPATVPASAPASPRR